MADFIKEKDLKDTYDQYTSYMDPLFKPFDEYERIARNRPHPGIAKGLPRVTDGTLSGLIHEQPKRIIQQVPTGKVNADDEWMEVVAGFIYEHEILPYANTQASLIQKCWALTTKTLTYGAQPVLVQFVKRGDYIGTDFTLPYVKDVFLEPGKLSDKDSNAIMVRAWYRPEDLDAMIDKERKLGAKAKRRGETYDSSWDAAVLKAAKKQVKEKQQEAQTANEKDKSTKSEVIEMVHVFQRGIKSTFYSFFPDLPDGDNVARRKTNPDPRGDIPVHYMYANVDLSNPLGRGSVELSGGMQNLLDSEVQSYQYMRALLINPPLEVRGNVRSSIIKFAPAAQWKLGTDPNTSVKPVELSTSSLESFPSNYGLIKSQILNLNSSLDTSVSADVGNPGFSKTPAGVDAQQQKLGVSDNYMRKQFESTFEDISETMINLYFAERHGVQQFQLDGDTAAKLKEIKPESVNEQNQIRVNFDQDQEQQLRFEVDASTSSMKDDAAERDRLIELLDISGKYPQFGDLMGQKGITELVNRIVVKSGVEDPEKIMPTADKSKLGPDGQPVDQQEQPQLGPQDVQQMIEQALQEYSKQKPDKPLHEQLGIKFETLPDDVQRSLIEQIFGIQSQAPTPLQVDQAQKQQDLNIKKVDTAAKHAGPSDAELQQADQRAAETQAMKAQDVQARQTQQQQAQGTSKPKPGAKTASRPAPKAAPQPAAQPSAGLTPDDKVLVDALQQRGFSPQQTQAAMTALQQGATPEDVLNMLVGSGGQQ